MLEPPANLLVHIFAAHMQMFRAAKKDGTQHALLTDAGYSTHAVQPHAA